VGKAPTVFPAVSPLPDAWFGGYPVLVVAELALHRGNIGFWGGKRMLSRRMFASCAICAAIGLVADDA